MSFGGETITVQRATFDRYNDATYVDHHTVSGVIQWPTGSVEGEMSVSDDRTLLAPPGSDIVPTDRVKLGGLTYQVKGLPTDWNNPFTGWAPGIEVRLERVT